ncbi:GNAT family N-acetyltransferase [Nocardia sp. NPDC051832]|uniref:GNAT family N-acetyltransferase n=1 Tax=Nocardia sp. NPDC051832 TaxID=3155673 RepID=UPI00343C947D
MPDNTTLTTHAIRPIPARDLLALYRTQEWWPDRTVAQLESILATTPTIAAWHEDRLIGFARAVTDGVLRAYLEDVIVAPGYRGQGLGSELVRRLLDELREIPVVSLFCGQDLVPFYEAAGFRPTRQVVLHR